MGTPRLLSRLLAPEKSCNEQLCNDDCWAKDLQAKPLIRFGTQRIIDTAHHFFDPEDLFYQLARHDVAIVTIGDGGKSISRFDACTLEVVPIDTIPNHFLTAKVPLKAVESFTAPVNDGNAMSCAIQLRSQCCPSTATAQDDNVHTAPPLGQRSHVDADKRVQGPALQRPVRLPVLA